MVNLFQSVEDRFKLVQHIFKVLHLVLDTNVIWDAANVLHHKSIWLD